MSLLAVSLLVASPARALVVSGEILTKADFDTELALPGNVGNQFIVDFETCAGASALDAAGCATGNQTIGDLGYATMDGFVYGAPGPFIEVLGTNALGDNATGNLQEQFGLNALGETVSSVNEIAGRTFYLGGATLWGADILTGTRNEYEIIVKSNDGAGGTTTLKIDFLSFDGTTADYEIGGVSGQKVDDGFIGFFDANGIISVSIRVAFDLTPLASEDRPSAGGYRFDNVRTLADGDLSTVVLPTADSLAAAAAAVPEPAALALFGVGLLAIVALRGQATLRPVRILVAFNRRRRALASS